nr:hypothetical protein K-LCC10_0399 [Kaumoebavirus]
MDPSVQPCPIPPPAPVKEKKRIVRFGKLKPVKLFA